MERGEENRINWCKTTAASFKGPLKYFVAKLHGHYQVQFHFRLAKIFSRAFFGAFPSPVQVAGDFCLLRCNEHKRNVSFTFS